MQSIRHMKSSTETETFETFHCPKFLCGPLELNSWFDPSQIRLPWT